MRQGLITASGFTPEQASETGALVRACRDYEPVAGVLNEEIAAAETETNQFLYYVNDILVGILTLPPGRHIEMLGMVHPDYRRRGIGRLLLEAGFEECRQRGVSRFLVVCEDASPAGRAFAEAMQGVYRFSEHRMKFDAAIFSPSGSPADAITLAQVNAKERETLTHLQSAAFGDRVEDSREWINRWLEEPNQRFYIGKWREQPVGILRAAFEREAIFLCTFGVLPEFRGRGFGRQILERAILELLPEGQPLFIEVETENDAALSLYLSCGFESVATFRYFEFQVSDAPKG